MKIHFVSLILFLLFIYPHIVLMSFVLFNKMFESFIVEQLSQLLEEINELKSPVGSKNQKLSLQYNKICNLVSLFNQHFGAQLATIVCGTSALLVSQVCLALLVE